MLVCDPADGCVQHASSNAKVFLGRDHTDLIGGTLGQAVGEDAAHDLRNAAAKTGGYHVSGVLLDRPLPGQAGRFNLAIHQNLGRLFIEIERASDTEDTEAALELTQSIIRRIGIETEVEKIAGSAAKLMRATLGYDRVMVYRFLHNGAGKVIAEAKRSDLQSFSEQYFPASDIPVQARRLYLINWIRMIGDIDFDPVALMPGLADGEEPIDMSYAHLRSVSSIHCEYLRNMGVSASMSVSIVVDGRLWGLIACHHDSPKYLPIPLRVGAELFAQYFSIQIALSERRTEFVAASAARSRIEALSAAFNAATDLDDVLREQLADLVELIPCDGAGVWFQGSWTGRGHGPVPADVEAVVHLVTEQACGRVWQSHELRRLLPGGSFGGAVAGVLAIPIGSGVDFLMLFRSEEAYDIEWAGEPVKTIVHGPAGVRLTPRGSFETWKEEVRGQSKPWTAPELVVAEDLRSFLRDVVLKRHERTADERTRADMRRRLLNDELNHRVKNIITLVKSIATQTGATARSVEDYSALLEGRLRALAFAHDQSLGGSGGDLTALLEAEASLHRDAETMEKVLVKGPPIGLNDRAFGVVALLMHEMITNAAKYGALSAADGRLVISWQITDNGDCAIDWVESGGPAVVRPERTGFGTKLIQSTISHDLGGSATIDYAATGLIGAFLIPARHLKEVVPASVVEEAKVLAPGDISGLRVMLVEDQALIAMDTEEILRLLGALSVKLISTTADALVELEIAEPDCAILDFNLGDESSVEIADRLIARKIPFVFATGYGDSVMIPARFSGVPVVRKPVSGPILAQKLSQVVGSLQNS